MADCEVIIIDIIHVRKFFLDTCHAERTIVVSGSFTRAIYDTSRARLTVEKVEYTRTRVWPPTVLFPRIDDRRSKQSIAINRPVRALRLGNCARVHQWRRVAFSFFFFFCAWNKISISPSRQKISLFHGGTAWSFVVSSNCRHSYIPAHIRSRDTKFYIYTYIYIYSFVFVFSRFQAWFVAARFLCIFPII